MELQHGLRLPLNGLSVVTFVGAGGKTSALFRLAEEGVAAGRRAITTTTTRMFTSQARQAPAQLVVGPDLESFPWQALDARLADHGHCLLATSLAGPKAEGVSPMLVDALAARAAEFGISLIAVEADGSRRRPLKAPAPHEPVVPDSTTHLVPVVGLDAPGRPLTGSFVHRPELVQALLGADPGARLTPEMVSRLLRHPQGGRKNLPAGSRFLPLLNKADQPPLLALARLIAQDLARRDQPSLIGTVGVGSASALRERWGSTAAVVLAAGASRRMGQPKQLLLWQGEPLVLRAVRTALASGAAQVIVVIGANADSVHSALTGGSPDIWPRLQIVHNQRWQEGQASSVRAALDALPPEIEAVQVFPVDQPLLPSALLRAMWRAWRTGHDLVAVSAQGRMRGAPAIFDRNFFGRLAQVQGDRGGGLLLQEYSQSVYPVEADRTWLADVDTPDEWRALLGSGAGSES